MTNNLQTWCDTLTGAISALSTPCPPALQGPLPKGDDATADATKLLGLLDRIGLPVTAEPAAVQTAISEWRALAEVFPERLGSHLTSCVQALVHRLGELAQAGASNLIFTGRLPRQSLVTLNMKFAGALGVYAGCFVRELQKHDELRTLVPESGLLGNGAFLLGPTVPDRYRPGSYLPMTFYVRSECVRLTASAKAAEAEVIEADRSRLFGKLNPGEAKAEPGPYYAGFRSRLTDAGAPA